MAIEIQAAAANTAEAAKTAAAKTTAAVKAALAKPAAKVAATGYAAKTKAFILAHSIGFTAAGGIIVGIGVYYLANKFWLNK